MLTFQYGVSEIVPPGQYTSSGDLIALPDHYLYWSVVQAGQGDALIRIDVQNKTTAKVGTLPSANVFGLGYANGNFLGYTGQGDIIQINSATAQGSTIYHANGLSWKGATTNPIKW